MKSRSPLAYVLGMADEALTVRDLVGSQRLWAVSALEEGSAAASVMTEHGFDIAPINEVPVERYVERAALVGSDTKVGEHALSIEPHMTLEESTPLGEALLRLSQRDHHFVVHRGFVTHVVTRADLSGPVVSLFVLGLILSLEMGLDKAITTKEGDGFLTRLSEERAQALRNLYASRIEANADIALEACLNLDDRLTIARKMGLYEMLGFSSGKSFERWAKRLKATRNAVAHASGVLEEMPDPVDALEFIIDLRQRCGDLWSRVEAHDAR